jgi:hypothetical protein
MENDWSVDIESVISGIDPRSTTATSSRKNKEKKN